MHALGPDENTLERKKGATNGIAPGESDFSPGAEREMAAVSLKKIFFFSAMSMAVGFFLSKALFKWQWP